MAIRSVASCGNEDEDRTAMLSQQIADHANLWWDNGNPEQA